MRYLSICGVRDDVNEAILWASGQSGNVKVRDGLGRHERAPINAGWLTLLRPTPYTGVKVAKQHGPTVSHNQAVMREGRRR